MTLIITEIEVQKLFSSRPVGPPEIKSRLRVRLSIGESTYNSLMRNTMASLCACSCTILYETSKMNRLCIVATFCGVVNWFTSWH